MQTKLPPSAIMETMARLWQRKSTTHVLQAWQMTRFSGKDMPSSYTFADVSNLVEFLGLLDRIVDDNVSTPLEPRLQTLIENVEKSTQPGQWNHSPYYCGLANGLLCAKAIMTDTDVKYLNAPQDGWLVDKSKELPAESPHAVWKTVHPS